MLGIGKTTAGTTTLRHLLHDESGQDVIEYVMLAALLAMGAIACMNGLVRSIGNVFTALEQYM